MRIDFAESLLPNETIATNVLPVAPYLILDTLVFLLENAFKEPTYAGVANTALLEIESDGSLSFSVL